MAGFNQESKYTEGVNVLSYNQAVVEVPALGSGTGDLKATDSYNEYSVRGGFSGSITTIWISICWK